jgi:hypothetical protein
MGDQKVPKGHDLPSPTELQTLKSHVSLKVTGGKPVVFFI